jgi:hypothetical protein
MGVARSNMLKVTLVAMDWCFRSKKVQMVAITAKVDVTFDHSSLNVNIQQSSCVDVNDNLLSLLIKMVAF